MNTQKGSDYILLIETATSICSVGLAEKDIVIAISESEMPNSHSAKLSILIDNLLSDCGIGYSDLSAVALSFGPGSYTGLRIGASTAKGLSYALDVPVIAVETPSILAKAALEKHKDCSVITMIDARRMEVYANIFSKEMEVLRDCSADVLTENYYDEFLKENEKVLLVGDGAAKTKELFANKQNYFYDDAIRLSSRFMATLAWEKYLKNEFVDTAYFEPYYLKDFIAVRSKVKGLR